MTFTGHGELRRGEKWLDTHWEDVGKIRKGHFLVSEPLVTNNSASWPSVKCGLGVGPNGAPVSELLCCRIRVPPSSVRAHRPDWTLWLPPVKRRGGLRKAASQLLPLQ